MRNYSYTQSVRNLALFRWTQSWCPGRKQSLSVLNFYNSFVLWKVGVSSVCHHRKLLGRSKAKTIQSYISIQLSQENVLSHVYLLSHTVQQCWHVLAIFGWGGTSREWKLWVQPHLQWAISQLHPHHLHCCILNTCVCVLYCSLVMHVRTTPTRGPCCGFSQSHRNG